MSDISKLKEQVEDLKGQQKQAEYSFHQIAGAIMVLEGQIQEAESAPSDNSTKDKAKKKVESA